MHGPKIATPCRVEQPSILPNPPLDVLPYIVSTIQQALHMNWYLLNTQSQFPRVYPFG